MSKKKILLILGILIVLLAVTTSTAGAQTEPVVRVILFHLWSCGHCEEVRTNVLPPLVEEYGDQLLVLGIEISQQETSALFTAVLEQIDYPVEEAGVPFMLVGDQYLIGAQQIPDQLPGIIEEGLANGGIDWPDVPAIRESLTAAGYIAADGSDSTPTPDPNQPTPTTAPAEAEAPAPTEAAVEDQPEPTPTTSQITVEVSTPTTEEPEILLLDGDTDLPPNSFSERFNQDPLANGIAVVVLIWLIGVVIYIAVNFMRAASLKLWPEWILPVLAVAGLGIAIYMGSIEVTGGEAICGPVGDCNAVQGSEYAKLFGVFPVAIFGIIGYVLIGASWWISRKTSGRPQFYAKLGMFLFALFGLLFFVYLTFLEPFVIGATCAWCISSAIIMSVINLSNLPVMLEAWEQIDLDDFDEDEKDE